MKLRLWSALLVLVKVMSDVEAQANLAKNVQEFNALCRLFLIAYENHKKPAADIIKGDVHWNQVNQIHEQLQGYVNQTDPSNHLPIELNLGREGMVRLKSQMALRKAHAMASSLVVKVKEAKRASEGLHKVVEAAARAVLEDLGKALAGENQKGLDEIDTKIPVLSGNAGTESQRQTACIGSDTGGEDKLAGFALSVDLMCLCAPAEHQYTQEICGFATNGGGTPWATSAKANTVTHLDTNWATIIGECKKDDSLGTTLTPENITSAIEHFNGLLGANVKSVATAATGKMVRWVLGVPKDGAQPACSGTHGSASQDCCVRYSKSNHEFAGIKWRTRMEDARARLLEIEEGKKKASRQVEIAEWAQAAFEAELVRLNISENFEAEAIDLGGKPLSTNQKQNPTPTNDKTIAQETNSVSTSTVALFLLPWSVLL